MSELRYQGCREQRQETWIENGTQPIVDYNDANDDYHDDTNDDYYDDANDDYCDNANDGFEEKKVP